MPEATPGWPPVFFQDDSNVVGSRDCRENRSLSSPWRDAGGSHAVHGGPCRRRGRLPEPPARSRRRSRRHGGDGQRPRGRGPCPVLRRAEARDGFHRVRDPRHAGDLRRLHREHHRGAPHRAHGVRWRRGLPAGLPAQRADVPRGRSAGALRRLLQGARGGVRPPDHPVPVPEMDRAPALPEDTRRGLRERSQHRRDQGSSPRTRSSTRRTFARCMRSTGQSASSRPTRPG